LTTGHATVALFAIFDSVIAAVRGALAFVLKIIYYEIL
jgi:hypothetical protein